MTLKITVSNNHSLDITKPPHCFCPYGGQKILLCVTAVTLSEP